MRPNRLMPVIGLFALGCSTGAYAAGASVPAEFGGCVASARDLQGLLESEVGTVVGQGAMDKADELSDHLQTFRATFGECAEIDSASALKGEFSRLYMAVSRFGEALQFAALTGNEAARPIVQQSYQGLLQETSELAKLAGPK